jgi:hypothetical protein
LTFRDEVFVQEVSIKLEFTSDITSAFSFHPILSGLLLSSAVLALRRPLPGESKEIASIIFVLPAPLRPNKAIGPFLA